MSNLKRYGGEDMLNVRELKIAMMRKGLNQEQLAQMIGMSSKTFGSDEIEKLILALDISEPMHIFFDGLVTCKDTKMNTKSA